TLPVPMVRGRVLERRIAACTPDAPKTMARKRFRTVRGDSYRSERCVRHQRPAAESSIGSKGTIARDTKRRHRQREPRLVRRPHTRSAEISGRESFFDQEAELLAPGTELYV